MTGARTAALLRWYRAQRRDLPWRGTTDPYTVLVSEVMLQQTQVARVEEPYRQFLDRFPTVAELAAAPLADVLDLWQGLGYPARAQRLREAAARIAEQGWPNTAAGLATLPGVGPYTAAAVASIAFGEPVAAVDTNVRRVIARWLGTPLRGRALATAADALVAENPGDWNQAVMELGALVCRPRPQCARCPVEHWCADPEIYLPPPPQGRFAGSLRQARGAVLRAVIEGGPARPAALASTLDVGPDRLAAAVDGLVADGILVRVGDRVRIAP